MRGKSYPESTKVRAIELYSQGVKLSDIAKELGIKNNSTIDNWITRSGLRKRTNIKRVDYTTGDPTWEQVKEFVLSAIEKASRVEQLEEEVYSLKNKLAATRNQLETYMYHDKKRTDEEIRYKVAVQQGVVKEPLVSNNGH